MNFLRIAIICIQVISILVGIDKGDFGIEVDFLIAKMRNKKTETRNEN